MTNSSSPEPVDLNDPAIEPLRLHELAQTHPHLWNEILQHPNVYPGLAQWIHDRQAEQGDSTEPESVVADGVTEQPGADENPMNAWFGHTTDQPAEETSKDAEQAQPVGWAQPSPAGSSQPFGAWSPQTSAQPQASPQSGYGYGQFGYQSPGYQQQFGGPQQPYHQAQPFYGQPGQYAQARRGASKIDLRSRRTWGSFIAGGAAFLALFGYFFSPTASPTSMPGLTHFGSGGWFLLVLLIATVAITVVDLLLPSRWTRYFFIVLGIGTAFALIGRYMMIAGMLSMYSAGFSLVWLIFMAIVLLAGTMVYLAPDMTTPSSGPTQQQQPQQYQSAPYQPGAQFNQPGGYGQQPGQYPHPGFGQQPGQYPQAQQPRDTQQFGGYYPPQQPGSPQ